MVFRHFGTNILVSLARLSYSIFCKVSLIFSAIGFLPPQWTSTHLNTKIKNHCLSHYHGWNQMSIESGGQVQMFGW